MYGGITVTGDLYNTKNTWTMYCEFHLARQIPGLLNSATCVDTLLDTSRGLPWATQGRIDERCHNFNARMTIIIFYLLCHV